MLRAGVAVGIATLLLGACLAACAELVGIGDLPPPFDAGSDATPEAAAPDAGDANTVDSSAGDERVVDASDAAKKDAPIHDAPSPDVESESESDAALQGFPSHTQPAYYEPEAGTLSGVTSIDTAALTINDTTTLPAGISFVYDTGSAHAVLSIGSWDIEENVLVKGVGAPLIVVAAGPITVNAVLSAAAVGSTPGPGAVTDTSAPGVGTAGCSSTSTGGGGGGFGSPGAQGGSFPESTGCVSPGGQVFGSLISEFTGGASGGAGDMPLSESQSGLGGGGGGAIQLSSAVSITVLSGGGIDVGGGAGQGGGAGTGAGGGAGGMIFLEAPTITVAGILAANGGGGGTGDDPEQLGASQPGTDGALGDVPAPGGPAEAEGQDLSPGGAGAAGSTDAGAGTQSSGEPSGGGGGLGRIWFRTRTTDATITGAVISGVKSTDTSL
jgi:hypothetical protein